VLGTIEADIAKHGLVAVEGTVEPEARDFYRNRGGLLLSIVGWEGQWGARGVDLPRPVHALLDSLVAAAPDGFEATVWADTAALDQATVARRDLLHGPWPAGVRHVILP